MFEDLLYALASFKRNKTRTLLSLLGIIIGVASVIVITALGKSTGDSVKNTFGSTGLDIISIYNNGPKHIRARVLSYDENFRAKLLNLPHVKTVYYFNQFPGTITRGTVSVNAETQCIEYGYIKDYGYKLLYGTDFTVSDHVQGSQKLLLGDKIAETLFPDGNPVGKQVILSRDSDLFGFEVIGVLTPSSAMDTNISTTIMVPRGFFIKKMDPKPDAERVEIKTDTTDAVAQVEQDVTDFINRETGVENVVWISSPLTMIKQINEAYATISIMLSAIAGISLLVGGIGIMNIMIVTVTERRKEIGIRKALGATPSDIRNQFLVESATLTLTGGAIGIGVGIIISAAILYARKLPFAIQWEACLIAFGFSVFVGIFFGLNPALRAAKLDPVEALASD